MNPSQHHPFPFPIPNSIHPPNPNPFIQISPNSHPQRNANPLPTLSDTLSSLSSLISLSSQTLIKFSNIFPDAPRGEHDDSCVRCPLDPHHVMPPEHLFRHQLACHTSLQCDSTLDSLNYHKTLSFLGKVNEGKDLFVQRVGDVNAQCCFSFDEYLGDSGSNFFYKEYPGVFSSNNDSGSDGVGSRKMFTLPGVLAVECANFVAGHGDVDGTETIKDDRRFHEPGVLPSGFWRVKMELEGWVGYPSSYSNDILQVILGMVKLNTSSFRRWVIGKSPQYGVIIDGALADHMLVLFSLCMKAIMREGMSLVNGLAAKRNNRSAEEFRCPHLVTVMMWLTSQFSVLCGDLNGKLFSIDMLKKCIGDAAASVMIYKHEDKINKSIDGIGYAGQTNSNCSNGEGGDEGFKMKVIQSDVFGVEKCSSEVIYVSQVAAAVAALHERSLLEGRIRALQQSVPLSRYQRMMEHTNITNRAAEERKKRADYKPIIDHDGLPRQPSSTQETSKTKTIEELLAEERDYKRRRMSYRGKKSKRNPSEVMRDIIEEYMEEIKEAGGIGCFEKSADIIPIKSSSDISSERVSLPDHQRPSSADRKTPLSLSFFDGNRPKHRRSIQHVEHLENEVERYNEYKLDRKYQPHSPERSRGKNSYERCSHWSEREDGDGLKSERMRSGSGRSKYDEHKSSSRWKSDKDRRQRSIHSKQGSNFPVRDEFEDRYDPSKSDDFTHQ